MKNKYLLEDTPETQEMLAKIKGMLESGEESNIELVFQIMEGGGISPQLLNQLLGLAIFYQDDDIRKKSRKYFKKIVPLDAYTFMQKEWNAANHYYPNELEISSVLEKVTTHSIVNLAELANFTLQLTNKGGKFCLEHQTNSPLTILHKLQENNYLSLENFGLTKLPKEIAQLNYLESLDLSGNPLKDLPDEMAHLKHLRHIYFSSDLVSTRVIKKLEKIFPTLLAQRYADDAWDLVKQEEPQKALNWMQKATVLDPNNSTNWDGMSWILSSLQKYADSIQCIDKALENSKTLIEKALYLVNKGSTLQRMRKITDSQEIAQEALDLIGTVPKKEWSVEHYFSQGLGLFLLVQYEQAHQAYEQAIKLNHYYGGGVCWYNKACAYAQESNKSEMLKALEKAMEIGWQFWHKEATIDCDFEKYWQDADFQEVLKNQNS